MSKTRSSFLLLPPTMDIDRLLGVIDGHPMTPDICFVCATPLTETNRSSEDVIPLWLQRRYELMNQRCKLQNGTAIQYRHLKVPCCKKCNNEHLSRLERIVEEAVTKGFEGTVALPEGYLYQWLVKIFLGLFYRELFLPANRKEAKSGPIMRPDSFHNLRTLWLWLQLSFNSETALRAPGSVFIFRCFVPDERKGQFDLVDDFFPGCIAIRLGEVGMVADFLDNHFHWDATWPRLEKVQKMPLHHFQFREMAAQIFYAARLLGLQIEVNVDRRDSSPTIITFKAESKVDGPALFWKFDREDYARMLAQVTGMPLNKVFSPTGKLWTWLYGESGNMIDVTKKAMAGQKQKSKSSTHDGIMARHEKFCIFCGNNPQSENKAQVIPQWLIEYTGDPKRKAFFGVDLNKEEPKLRTYSFDSFIFPSCEPCNSEFADLEDRAKRVVMSLDKMEAVSESDMDTLLDWLDKLRVGLWLGYYYLDKNHLKISPKFHIKTRIRTRDRLVVIQRVSNAPNGINFVGTDSLGFQYAPSCFALRVNGLLFFNASHIGLCDRRLGFPFSKESFWRNDSNVERDIVGGLERKFYPVIRSALLPPGTRLYQPIYQDYVLVADPKSMFYTEYAKQNSIDWQHGIGGIFLEKDGAVERYPESKSTRWLPDWSSEFRVSLPQLAQAVYEFQVYMASNAASLKKLDKEKEKSFKSQMERIKKSTSLLVEFVKKQVER